MYQACTRPGGSIAANELDHVPVLMECFKGNSVLAYCQTFRNINLF